MLLGTLNYHSLLTGSTGIELSPTAANDGGNPYTLWAALVTVVGLIVVAIITASTTNRRQREQLDHDQRRHQERLRVEQAAQVAQLEHDREVRAHELDHDRRVRDTIHLRDFFDDAVQALDLAMLTATSYLESLLVLNDHQMEVSDAFAVEGDNDTRDALEKEVAAARTAAESASYSSFGMLRRMDLRLDVDHPVRDAFGGAASEIQEAIKVLYAAPPLTDEMHTQALDHLATAMADFVKITIGAQKTIGAKFSEEEMREAEIYISGFDPDPSPTAE